MHTELAVVKSELLNGQRANIERILNRLQVFCTHKFTSHSFIMQIPLKILYRDYNTAKIKKHN